MQVPKYYKKPLFVAVLLHVLLMLVLLINFAPTMFRTEPSSAPMQTVHATTVTEASVNAEINKVRQQPALVKEAQEKEQHVEAQKKLAEARAVAAAKERVLKAQQLVLEKAKESKLKALEHQKAQLAAKEARATASASLALQKKLQEEELKQETVQKKQMEARAKASALSAQQKKLQQELMQQQMANESKNISSVISQAQQGAIDKYKAEILSVIQSNWRISQVNSKLKCIYSVSLAPDGTVLSEKLVKSSGDDDLDQSAKQAIVLSSPLPVPTDPSTFNHFRQLVLTLSPQGYLQSVGNA